MLLAYLDEFGHVGPFVASDHKRFRHHPVFGYAGFVIPAHHVRAFGAKFASKKKKLFRSEAIAAGKDLNHWEKKGAEIFTTGSYSRYPMRATAIAELVQELTKLGGRVFFYGQVKPVGVESVTAETASERSSHHLRQTMNRLSFYADSQASDILIFLDSVDLKPRQDAVDAMASHLYSSRDPKLKRVVEVPMQLESHLYGLTQFADWIAAVVTRTTHYHFTPGSEFGWAPQVFRDIVGTQCTTESRIWLRDDERAVKPGALAHSAPWHALESAAPRRTPGRRRSFKPLSAGAIGNQVPQLQAFYETLRHDTES